MAPDSFFPIFFGGLALIAFLIIFIFIRSYTKRKAKAKAIFVNYQQALRGTDKQAALQLGRAYYSTLRNGSLSIYDEQAITNDISTMK